MVGVEVSLFAAVIGRIEAGEQKLNSVDSDGRTALHHAVAAGDIELFEELLERGAATDTKDEGGWTPLHSAASAGRVEIATLLLASQGGGVDVNACVDGSGSTPLIFAASKGHGEIVRLLLEARADLRARDGSGATALHRAAGRGQVHIIGLLTAALRPASAIDDRDALGQTAFHVAAVTEQWDACVALAEAGADCATVDNEGNLSRALLSPSLQNQVGLLDEQAGDNMRM